LGLNPRITCLHLHLNPDSDDREAEIERIVAFGARRVDIAQKGTEAE
jgi:Glyoxalase-like domain